MKCLAAPLIFLAIVGFVAGCGESHASSAEAEHAAVAWLAAMAESNVTRACKLMDADNHKRSSKYRELTPAEFCRQMWLHSDNTPWNWEPRPDALSIWGETDPKILSVDIEGNEAIVTIEGAGQGRPIWLQEEDGHWLVDRVEYPI